VKSVDEKRSERRYRTDVPLILKLFPSFKYHPAEELNQSNSGLSLKLNVSLKPGTIAYIRREGCPQNCTNENACENCRTISLVIIKWCNPIGTGESFSYSIGAKYFEYGAGY